MKKKDRESLRTETVESLKKKLDEHYQSLARIAKERYTKQSKNVREGKGVRQQIARIKTLLREKELSV